MNEKLIGNLKGFWSDIREVENADAEDIQNDILAYLTVIEELLDENKKLKGAE